MTGLNSTRLIARVRMAPLEAHTTPTTDAATFLHLAPDVRRAAQLLSSARPAGAAAAALAAAVLRARPTAHMRTAALIFDAAAAAKIVVCFLPRFPFGVGGAAAAAEATRTPDLIRAGVSLTERAPNWERADSKTNESPNQFRAASVAAPTRAAAPTSGVRARARVASRRSRELCLSSASPPPPDGAQSLLWLAAALISSQEDEVSRVRVRVRARRRRGPASQANTRSLIAQ